MEKEDLKYKISRFDHCYESANNKGNFYIGYNIFILGGILTIKKEFNNLLICDSLLYQLIIILISLSCFSIFFILLSSLAFLKSGNSKKYKSILFFGSISDMKKAEYEFRLEQCNTENFTKDLQCQSYELANGLNKKYFYIKLAGICMLTQMVFLFIIILTIIKN